MPRLRMEPRPFPLWIKLSGREMCTSTLPKNSYGVWWTLTCWPDRAKCAWLPTSTPIRTFAALDLLTQAEHDVEAAAFLITSSETLAQATLREIERQLARLPRRDILLKSLEDNSAVLVTETLQQAYDLANACAPEHLALMVRDPLAALGHIRNAGAILMGDYTPQTLGDYYAGPSHTLPTSGTARFASPLHVDTFVKKSSFLYYSKPALEQVADALTSFACAEGFDAHAEAVRVRIHGSLASESK